MRTDLRLRLETVRWSDAVTTDWQYGMNQQFLTMLVDYWRTQYDFDAVNEHGRILDAVLL